jgi:DNA transformation protein
MNRVDLEDIFSPLGPVTVKRMFGGHGIYLDGLFFAIEAGGEIYLKVDTSNEDLFRKAGSRPFVYESPRGSRTMAYWLMPEAAHDDPDELVRWCRHALARAAVSKANKPTLKMAPSRKGAQPKRASGK